MSADPTQMDELIRNRRSVFPEQYTGEPVARAVIEQMLEAKELFELGEDDRLIGFLHVGTPKGTPPPVRRRPVEDLVSWVDE